jgi:hypothetical protein
MVVPMLKLLGRLYYLLIKASCRKEEDHQALMPVLLEAIERSPSLAEPKIPPWSEEWTGCEAIKLANKLEETLHIDAPPPYDLWAHLVE